MTDLWTAQPQVDLSWRPSLSQLRPVDSAAAEARRTEGAGIDDIMLERARRPRITPPGEFEGRKGFNAHHLGDFEVGLPAPVGARARDVTPVGDDPSGRLDYTHFSVVMSAERRMAMFTAVNIEGARSVSIERSNDQWAFDGRIALAAQLGDELYAGNRLDRGHMVRREDPNWGPEAETANRETSHFTNAVPQVDVVNQQTWLGLENYILQNARAWRERCSVFTGPVFGRSDLSYRGALVPKAFWKVVAFLRDDGRPSATAYLVEQEEELGGLEAAFGAYKTYQRSVRYIERLTGLRFGDLQQYDGFSNDEGAMGIEITSELPTLGAIRL
jgi:endonuclease G